MGPKLALRFKTRLWLLRLFDWLCCLPPWWAFHRIVQARAAHKTDFFLSRLEPMMGSSTTPSTVM